LPYDLHHTQIETRQERIKAGKGVDAGTNMAAGIGGLGSFTDMVGGAYNETYKDLLEGNPNKNLPAGEAKKMISSGKKTNDNQIGGNSNINPLDLFNKPNKFG
jgi:calcineurin-like phosphoesterase